MEGMIPWKYRQTCSIGHTNSQLNISPLVMKLSLSNTLKPGVKARLKMYLQQRWQAMLQLHLSETILLLTKVRLIS